MGTRIWHQSGAALTTMGAYSDALSQHLKTAVSPDTEVVMHGIRAEMYAGRPPAAVLKYAYARQLILPEVIENCIRAEREGYDAVTIASYSEPFVREARSVVDIPVVSMVESTLLAGCAVAARMALVTLTPENIWRIDEMVERHKLGGRVQGIHAFDPPTDERQLALAFEAPDELLTAFHRVARRAIAAGAELIIPAEGVLNEVLFKHGVQRIDDVPVMDCVGVVFAWTEMMVKLRAASGLSVGRRWSFARPDQALLDDLRRAAGLE